MKREFKSSLALSQVNGVDTVTQSTTGYNLVIKEPGTRGHTDSADQEKSNEAIKNKKKDPAEMIEFNAADVLADQFLGSGYKSALNLITTSGEFNKKTMGDAEKYIRAELEKFESVVQSRNKENYITFDITVTAQWNPLTDSEVIKALTGSNPGMKKEDNEAIQKIIAADVDPKLVDNVLYSVDIINIKDTQSKVIQSVKPRITKTIEADETLKKNIEIR